MLTMEYLELLERKFTKPLPRLLLLKDVLRIWMGNFLRRYFLKNMKKGDSTNLEDGAVKKIWY